MTEKMTNEFPAEVNPICQELLRTIVNISISMNVDSQGIELRKEEKENAWQIYHPFGVSLKPTENGNEYQIDTAGILYGVPVDDKAHPNFIISKKVIGTTNASIEFVRGAFNQKLEGLRFTESLSARMKKMKITTC